MRCLGPTSQRRLSACRRPVRTGIPDAVRTWQAVLRGASIRALASGLAHAIFAGRLVVFDATVYLRCEELAVFAAVDMRLTGNFFLWVIDVERVLVRGTTFEVGRFQGFLHV